MNSNDGEIDAVRGYPAHRERQRRRILDAAERLLDERGIDRVNMAEITSASGVRASTVYQYFSNKDEIVWAIVDGLFKAAADELTRAINKAPNGLAKITALLESMADKLETEPAKVRLMAQFDVLYAREGPVERLLMLEAQINPQGFRPFSDLICEGILDGSLRSDLDPDLTLHAVVNAAIGAQRRLASLGNKVEIEYGQPVGILFRETIRLILLGLRAGEASRARKPAPRRKALKRNSRKRS